MSVLQIVFAKHIMTTTGSKHVNYERVRKTGKIKACARQI